MTEDEMVSVTNSMDMNLSKLWEVQEYLVYCSPLNRRVGHDLAIEQEQAQNIHVLPVSYTNSLCFICEKKKFYLV